MGTGTGAKEINNHAIPYIELRRGTQKNNENALNVIMFLCFFFEFSSVEIIIFNWKWKLTDSVVIS